MGTDGCGAELETGAENSGLWWEDSFLTKMDDTERGHERPRNMVRDHASMGLQYLTRLYAGGDTTVWHTSAGWAGRINSGNLGYEDETRKKGLCIDFGCMYMISMGGWLTHVHGMNLESRTCTSIPRDLHILECIMLCAPFSCLAAPRQGQSLLPQVLGLGWRLDFGHIAFETNRFYKPYASSLLALASFFIGEPSVCARSSHPDFFGFLALHAACYTTLRYEG